MSGFLAIIMIVRWMMIKIIRAKVEDVEILIETCVNAFHSDLRFHLFGTEPSGPPGYDSLQWNLARIRDAFYYKIIMDGNIVGGMILFKEGSKQDRVEMVLGRIWVDPLYQNLGIGQEAIRQMYNHHQEVTRWRLDTPSYATRNHQFYEKMGFRMLYETEVDPDLGWSSFEYEKVMK
jgi:GNAT superfamily N-acetyltransferase